MRSVRYEHDGMIPDELEGGQTCHIFVRNVADFPNKGLLNGFVIVNLRFDV